MDSTDKPRSTVPVAITVASEQEPVECDGYYTARDDGFILEFSIRDDRFTIEHCADFTVIRANGVLSYDIKLEEAVGSTLLGTPYGKIRFDVKTVGRRAERTENSVRVVLEYLLASETTGEIARAVDVTAHFSN